MNRLVLAAFALTLASCSMLGRESEFAKQISTSGVGPFRPLVAGETGVTGSQILRVADAAIHRGSVAGEVLFVDLEDDAGRAIHRATRIGRCAGFQAPVLALGATEAWEGDHVREPFALVREDGSIRVYYAAEGGIGVAEAERADAPLVKSPDNPILEGALSGPTVIEDDNLGTLLYFEEDGRIHAARSDDGVRFERVGGPLLPLLVPDDPPADGGVDRSEVAHRLPGAVVAAMPTGRRTVRLYFAVIHADGTSAVTMAASLDGLEFERATTMVLSGDDVTAPVPHLGGDDELTHLTFVRVNETTSTLHGALSPLTARLPGHPDLAVGGCASP